MQSGVFNQSLHSWQLLLPRDVALSGMMSYSPLVKVFLDQTISRSGQLLLRRCTELQQHKSMPSLTVRPAKFGQQSQGEVNTPLVGSHLVEIKCWPPSWLTALPDQF